MVGGKLGAVLLLAARRCCSLAPPLDRRPLLFTHNTLSNEQGLRVFTDPNAAVQRFSGLNLAGPAQPSQQPTQTLFACLRHAGAGYLLAARGHVASEARDQKPRHGQWLWLQAVTPPTPARSLAARKRLLSPRYAICLLPGGHHQQPSRGHPAALSAGHQPGGHWHGATVGRVSWRAAWHEPHR